MTNNINLGVPIMNVYACRDVAIGLGLVGTEGFVVDDAVCMCERVCVCVCVRVCVCV